MGMTIDEKNKFIEESKEHFKEWHDMNYIPKADYEARLKADMVAMLKEIQLEIEELDPFGDEWSDSLDACNDIIQQKINNLQVNNSKVN